jgi:transposase
MPPRRQPRRQSGAEVSDKPRRLPHISPEDRLHILAKSETGVSIAELANEFGRSSSAIKYTLGTYANRSNTLDKSRSGRPPILSDRAMRSLVSKARASDKIEYGGLAKAAQGQDPEGESAKLPSCATLYRALKKKGLMNRKGTVGTEDERRA